MEAHNPQSFPRSPNSSTNTTAVLLQRWSEFVSTYTNGKLSRQSDKLVACSVMAKEMSPFLGDYTAGLWKDYMPSQLLWYQPSFRMMNSTDELHRGRSRLAPTWSWASLDCYVQLPCYCEFMRDPRSQTMQPVLSSRAVQLDKPALIKILDVSLVYSGKDITGSVDGGKLRLRGWLYPVYRSGLLRTWQIAMQSSPESYRANPMNAWDQNRSPLWYWDEPGNLDSGGFEWPKARHDRSNDDEFAAEGDEDSSAAGTCSDSHRSWLAGILTKLVVKPINHLSLSEQNPPHSCIQQPILTSIFCLPVASWGPFRAQDGIAGLILEHTGDSAGQYRRLGRFHCRKDVVDGLPRVDPFTLPFNVPLAEEFNDKEGYKICIV